MKILLIGLGGFLGAVLRYLASYGIHKLVHEDTFPAGTFIVNMIGCLFIGMALCFASHSDSFNEDLKFFLITGLLGAFTTYSTFTHDTYVLLTKKAYFLAFGNVAGQLFLGLVATALGYFIINTIKKKLTLPPSSRSAGLRRESRIQGS